MPRTVQQELSATNKEIEGLIAKRDRLLREITERRNRPAPPSDQSRWAIDVRFSRGGGLYEFLILRANGKFYTTGASAETAVFHSWEAFLRWLDDNTASHSAMIPLVSDYDEPAALEGKRF